MKIAQITQTSLLESYICNNDKSVARYMQAMNENFVVPFNRQVLSEVALDAQTINNIFKN